MYVYIYTACLALLARLLACLLHSVHVSQPAIAACVCASARAGRVVVTANAQGERGDDVKEQQRVCGCLFFPFALRCIYAVVVAGHATSCARASANTQAHRAEQARTHTHTHMHVDAENHHIFSFVSAARCCLRLRLLACACSKRQREGRISRYPCRLASGMYARLQRRTFIVCRREYRASSSRFDFLLVSPAAATIAR